MQSVSSLIWTRVAVSISYDDNDYTTGTHKGWYAIKPNQTKSLPLKSINQSINRSIKSDKVLERGNKWESLLKILDDPIVWHKLTRIWAISVYYDTQNTSCRYLLKFTYFGSC